MLTIDTRSVSNSLTEVRFRFSDTTVDLGLLDSNERIELAVTLLDAASELLNDIQIEHP